MKKLKKLLLGLCAAAALSAITVWAWPITPTVTLAWDQSPAPVTHYIVYWGTESRGYEHFQMTDKTSITLQGVFQRGVKYYFAVTAVDGANNLESDFSNEVDYTWPILVPAPVSFRIQQAN